MDKVKNIFKPITRDIRINQETIWSPKLVTGKINKIMRNEPNFNTSVHFATPHEPRVTRDERSLPAVCVAGLNMQNEPNFKHTAQRVTGHKSRVTSHAKQTQSHSGIYPGAPGLIYSYTHLCKTNPISTSERRETGDERRIMQNEPNLQNKRS